MATDYAADARGVYTDLLAAGGVATLTRPGASAVDLATDTVTGSTTTATTAGVLLPPIPRQGRDGAYSAGTLTRRGVVRVLLASVDADGAVLSLTPQAGDTVAIGARTVTLAYAEPLCVDGVTTLFYDGEGEG